VVRIVIRGYAAVYGPDDQLVTDLTILRTLGGLAYDAERFTDHLDARGRIVPEEAALAAVLDPGGEIRFEHRGDEPALTATTEYQSRRALIPNEVRALVAYTMGQWSDGIGENLWWCPIHPTYGILCLWSEGDVRRHCPAAVVGPQYPLVEVSEF
jgi:hypothetical protein